MGEPRLRLLEPGLRVLSWDHSTWKDSWGLLQSLGRSCTVLGMCSRARPTSICMEALSETLRPTQNLGICWLGATALLHRTFHLLLLRRHCKITFLIGTRYDGFIWLLLTHGVRGSTTLLKSEQWLTWWNILQTPLTCAVWFHWCRKAVGFLPDAAGLSTGMPLITQNFLVICSGPVGCKGSIGLLIPWHKAPLSCPQTLTFVPWGSITSMKPFQLKERQIWGRMHLPSSDWRKQS